MNGEQVGADVIAWWDSQEAAEVVESMTALVTPLLLDGKAIPVVSMLSAHIAWVLGNIEDEEVRQLAIQALRNTFPTLVEMCASRGGGDRVGGIQ